MKDLNELMQEILDMDTAQRKATENAQAERRKAMGLVAEQKAQIEKEYAEETRKNAEAAMEAQKQKCDVALAALREKQQAESKRMAAAAAAQKDAWAQTLAQHVIEG